MRQLLTIRDIFDLVAVAAFFAAAFLFMRVAAPEFGAIPLIEVRLVAAALILMPIILLRSGPAEMMLHWRAITMMAVLHYVLPFCLFAYALLTLTGSFTAIINASTPLFGGFIAWVWISERLPALRIVGLLVGFAGVVLLVWDKIDLNFDAAGIATLAAMSASFCYGLAAVLAKRHLTGVSPLAVAAGSMFAGMIILFPFAIYAWPEISPSKDAWIMAILLGVLCTAIAFVLYFRLIAGVGPTKATTVTFLVPAFAVGFGSLLLSEPVTLSMIAGGAVIIVGTAMSTGLLKTPLRG